MIYEPRIGLTLAPSQNLCVEIKSRLVFHPHPWFNTFLPASYDLRFMSCWFDHRVDSKRVSMVFSHVNPGRDYQSCGSTAMTSSALVCSALDSSRW